MCITIDNQSTDLFSEDDVRELQRFVNEDILSQEADRNGLDVIKIRRINGNLYEYGWWEAEFEKDKSGKTIRIQATIVLNTYIIKTLNKLKETLAHEYGHHWTLSYLAINQQLDVWKERLPQEYYQHRQLIESDTVYDVDDCGKQWNKCDKEIIAEDYRVLFTPFNQDHCMVNDTLPDPNEATRQYIENLP